MLGTPTKSQSTLIAAGSSAAPTPGSSWADDEAALLRLWREKRGEVSRRTSPDNLIVQLGVVTEELNRLWYERNTDTAVKDVQRQVPHPVLDGRNPRRDGRDTGAVFEAKFMLPWSFSEEAAAEKHMAQLQHNMWVVDQSRRFCRSSPEEASGSRCHSGRQLYQHLLITAEKKFWRCVQTGEHPRPFLVEPPRPRIEAVRMVDMSASNSWAEFAGIYRSTRAAFLEHERAKGELKALVPEDAKEARAWGPGQALEVGGDQLRPD